MMVSKKHSFWFYVLVLLQLVQKWLLDPLLDMLLGYRSATGWKQERQDRVYRCNPNTVKYEKSAQMIRVWWRVAFDANEPCHLKHYIFTHTAYINPKHILRSPQLFSFQGITEHEVVFCVTDHPKDLPKGPFAQVANYLSAKYFIRIPHWAFNRAAEWLEEQEFCPDPLAEILFIYRLGPTADVSLLSRTLNDQLNMRILQDPLEMSSVKASNLEQRLSKPDFERLLKNLIILLLSHSLSSLPLLTFERLVVMVPSWLLTQMVVIRDRLPWIRQVLFASQTDLMAASTSWPSFLVQPVATAYNSITRFGTNLLVRNCLPSVAGFGSPSSRSYSDRKANLTDLLDYIIVYESFLADPDSEMQRFSAANGLEPQSTFIRDAERKRHLQTLPETGHKRNSQMTEDKKASSSSTTMTVSRLFTDHFWPDFGSIL